MSTSVKLLRLRGGGGSDRVHTLTSMDQLDSLKDEGKLIVLDFHATWCGPCQSFAPHLQEIASTEDSVIFAKVDVDNVPELAEYFEIEALPTFVFIKNGEEVKSARILGADVEKFRRTVQQLK